MNKSPSKYKLVLLLNFVALIAVMMFSVFVSANGGVSFDLTNNLLTDIRAPRTICSALIGAGLSACGCVMQGMLKNPLADGTTLGVSSGASIGAIMALCGLPFIAVGVEFFGQLFVVLISILFSIISFLVIIIVSFSINRKLNNNTIILVGIIFTMLCNSVISIFVTFFPESAKTYMFWIMGSLSGMNYLNVVILLTTFISTGIVFLIKAKDINVLSLGDAKATTLGLNVRKIKIVLMLAVSAMIGVCVSMSGMIAFIGLIVPHLCRKLVGQNCVKLLPVTMIFGAWFLVLCDILSRFIIYPKELPIGIITSIVGVVVFVLIFYQNRNRG